MFLCKYYLLVSCLQHVFSFAYSSCNSNEFTGNLSSSESLLNSSTSKSESDSVCALTISKIDVSAEEMYFYHSLNLT